MIQVNDQILSVAQMRAAEDALIDAGSSVDALMLRAGLGAAEWIYRLAWPSAVTVLCGPGNNGGDGYVIAEALRARNLPVTVVAPLEPSTDAARNARQAYRGSFSDCSDLPAGAVFVDCLFGSGVTRSLDDGLLAILHELANRHSRRVAVDLPSGVESDTGRLLNDGLPSYELTLALGSWKFAHWTMPSSSMMGERHLIDIGVDCVPCAAQVIAKPQLYSPAANAHKYTRGLAAVIPGMMPGAALLASTAAMHGGAGYTKIVTDTAPHNAPPELVADPMALADPRLSALLIGPGLGRSDASVKLLEQALACKRSCVLDADALVLLKPDWLQERDAPIIATPHEGELAALATSWNISASGKRKIATELAASSGMVVLAKGADTVIAAPDGRVALSRTASSWLSTAGTGDVLAGLTVSRMATGTEAFRAACEAVWLHSEAARLAGPVFTAGALVSHIPAAYAASL